MEQPDEVNLSRQDGDALIKRLQGDALTAQDRRVLEQVLRWYFWLLFALQEARFSLKRLRAMVFGDRAKQRPQKPSAGGGAAGGGGAGGPGAAPAEAPELQADSASTPPSTGEGRSGHGRLGAQAYSGAAHVVCHHETLTIGERCPVCGRGRLYRVEPGVEVRLDGHALLSAVRYALEKLRCSACGQVFTAATPAEAGAEKYSARARAVLVLGRYYLGVPLYRLEGYQAMVGVPVSDATQWDQIEQVASCA
jgi:rRNA maturation protein Nop10